ncbi:hypothetical protein HDU97_001035 [Phlyctochytrium planicorne]|nr:hypothetical protein HDU97_001035 [Phlyctochytrium planicorne]
MPATSPPPSPMDLPGQLNNSSNHHNHNHHNHHHDVTPAPVVLGGGVISSAASSPSGELRGRRNSASFNNNHNIHSSSSSTASSPTAADLRAAGRRNSATITSSSLSSSFASNMASNTSANPASNSTSTALTQGSNGSASSSSSSLSSALHHHHHHSHNHVHHHHLQFQLTDLPPLPLTAAASPPSLTSATTTSAIAAPHQPQHQQQQQPIQAAILIHHHSNEDLTKNLSPVTERSERLSQEWSDASTLSSPHPLAASDPPKRISSTTLKATANLPSSTTLFPPSISHHLPHHIPHHHHPHHHAKTAPPSSATVFRQEPHHASFQNLFHRLPLFIRSLPLSFSTSSSSSPTSSASASSSSSSSSKYSSSSNSTTTVKNQRAGRMVWMLLVLGLLVFGVMIMQWETVEDPDGGDLSGGVVGVDGKYTGVVPKPVVTVGNDAGTGTGGEVSWPDVPAVGKPVKGGAEEKDVKEDVKVDGKHDKGEKEEKGDKGEKGEKDENDAKETHQKVGSEDSEKDEVKVPELSTGKDSQVKNGTTESTNGNGDKEKDEVKKGNGKNDASSVPAPESHTNSTTETTVPGDDKKDAAAQPSPKPTPTEPEPKKEEKPLTFLHPTDQKYPGPLYLLPQIRQDLNPFRPPHAQEEHPDQFRYHIPRLVHITVPNAKQIDNRTLSNIRKWKELNEDLEVMVHDDGMMRQLVEDVEAVFEGAVEVYESFRKGVERADFWRYVVVWVWGGVYADGDVVPLRGVDGWWDGVVERGGAVTLFGNQVAAARGWDARGGEVEVEVGKGKVAGLKERGEEEGGVLKRRIKGRGLFNKPWPYPSVPQKPSASEGKGTSKDSSSLSSASFDGYDDEDVIRYPIQAPLIQGLVGMEGHVSNEMDRIVHAFTRQIQFCQWTFAFRRRHPFLRDVIVKIIEEGKEERKTKGWAKGKGRWEETEGWKMDVLQRTGPGVWTRGVEDWIEEFGMGDDYNLRGGGSGWGIWRWFKGLFQWNWGGGGGQVKPKGKKKVFKPPPPPIHTVFNNTGAAAYPPPPAVVVDPKTKKPKKQKQPIKNKYLRPFKKYVPKYLPMDATIPTPFPDPNLGTTRVLSTYDLIGKYRIVNSIAFLPTQAFAESKRFGGGSWRFRWSDGKGKGQGRKGLGVVGGYGDEEVLVRHMAEGRWKMEEVKGW